MADPTSPQQQNNNKPGLFAKASKRIIRTKTKVLQNLGKAEKTTDDVFTDNVQKIEKQQETARHLQKELKNYVHCIRDLCQASKGFHAALLATYEPEWTEEETFKAQVQTFDLLWNDYLQTIHDKVMAPMATYLQSFPSLKNKALKRGRKMVDFDNSRHHLEVLQAAKKKDEVKIQKATEDLTQAKRIYEEINNELHTELPDFHNSRVTFYAELFSSLFGAEYIFHSEQGKTNGTLGDISQRLGKDYEQFVYKPKRPLSKTVSNNSTSFKSYVQSSPSSSRSSMEKGINGEASGSSAPSTPVGTLQSSETSKAITEPIYNNQDVIERKQHIKDEEAQEERLNGDHQASSQEEDHTSESPPQPVKRTTVADNDVSDDEEDTDDNVKAATTPDSEDANLYEEPVEAKSSPVMKHTVADDDDKHDEEDDDENIYKSPPSNHDAKLVKPPDMLYMVQATHAYVGEDEDELSFEKGEVIFVVEFENPEEQDDGWQMGIKVADGPNGPKAVFPENFTKRLEAA